jgi:hypothetical protein
MIAAAVAALALAAVLGLAACDAGKSIDQRARETCGKGKVAYVDVNSQQYGCKR